MYKVQNQTLNKPIIVFWVDSVVYVTIAKNFGILVGAVEGGRERERFGGFTQIELDQK